MIPRPSENAGGVPAISRGLSESASDTPGQHSKTSRTPAGCQPRSPHASVLRPLPGRGIHLPVDRGYRGAQPPTNFLYPSGMLRAATSDKEKATLQNAVTATDPQIDQLVYELYALTPEEIALVEGA